MSQTLKKIIYNPDNLPWIFICIGIALRLVRYFSDPSLYFDEAVYATDIISRPYADFFNPSPNIDHGLPFGFVLITKLASNLFGNSEYALRLFPLLMGITSLLLIHKAAKEYISPKAVPAAVALFAVLDSLVYYSSLLKPYAGDVAFALLIMVMAIYVHKREINMTRLALFAVTGAVAVWVSNPSVFVLAGVGAGMLVTGLKRREWSRIGYLSIIFSLWGLSFAAVYYFYTRNLYTAINIGWDKLLSMEHAFMPFPPKSLADIRWFIDTFFDTFLFCDSFDFSERLTLTGIMAFAFIVGFVSMFTEKRDRFFILLSPILFTLLAAVLHKYPFKGRAIQFLVPVMIFFVAEGIGRVREITRDRSAVIGVALIVLVFIYPVSWGAYHIKNPLSRSDIKPVLSYIKNNWQEGDAIYVHFYAQYEFDYYLKYNPEPIVFEKNGYHIGIAPRGWYNRWKKQEASKYYDANVPATQSNAEIREEYRKDLKRLLDNDRIWVLFTGGIKSMGMGDEKFYRSYLDTFGEQIDSFGHTGQAVTYLYNFEEQLP